MDKWKFFTGTLSSDLSKFHCSKNNSRMAENTIGKSLSPMATQAVVLAAAEKLAAQSDIFAQNILCVMIILLSKWIYICDVFLYKITEW